MKTTYKSFAFGVLASAASWSAWGQPTPLNATGYLPDPSLGEKPPIVSKALASSLDNRRFFGPIKDQGACGSCAVFAATGLLEGALVRDRLLLAGAESLSEQLTLDCLANVYPNLCKSGSNAPLILDTLTGTGTTTSKVVPYGFPNVDYASSYNSCIAGINSTTSSNFSFNAASWKKIAVANRDDVKQAIDTYGAVFASLLVTQTFQGYGSSSPDIVMAACRAGGCGWHAILLLGWDDGRQAFLGRNSWSSSWGQGGYFWIKYTEMDRYSVSKLIAADRGVWVVESTARPFNYVTPPRPEVKTLTISKTGSGEGGITSATPGINCGALCMANFTTNANVDLTAVAKPDSDLVGWVGGCAAGTAANVCRVNMKADNVVIADFSAKPRATLDAGVVGIIGVQLAAVYDATPLVGRVDVQPGTRFSAEINKIDVLALANSSPIVIDRFVPGTTARYDRDANRDKFAVLTAKELVLDPAMKGKEIVVTHPNVTRVDGTNGAIGANGANGAGEVNRNGNPGAQGAQGGRGQDGTAKQYAQVVMVFEKINWSTGGAVAVGDVTFRFDFEGNDGGHGGNGGTGGRGGNGAPGKQGASGLFDCSSGAGSGGQGGDGGVGGLPGIGGDGGHGADVVVFSPLAQIPLIESPALSLAGGLPGGGGNGGASGGGGSGGGAAPSNGWCGAGRGGPNGTSPGANLGVGATGLSGKVGSYIAYALSPKSLAGSGMQDVGKEFVEFYLPERDNYFMTAQPGEQQVVDSGSVGAWTRTGYTFKAGGSIALCRFYGNTAIDPSTGGVFGPRSHFFTADPNECKLLKDIWDSKVKSWKFEGLDTYVTLPIATANGKVCPPSAPVPIYRAYNNGFAKGLDSNHRFSSDHRVINDMIVRGWIDEGVVMCTLK